MQVGQMSGAPIIGSLCPKFHQMWGSGMLEKSRLGKFGAERRRFVEKCYVLLLPQLHGVLRVILEPLMGDLPIVGAVSMFFIRRPVRENIEGNGEAGKTGLGGRGWPALGLGGGRAEGSGNCWMGVTMPPCPLS